MSGAFAVARRPTPGYSPAFPLRYIVDFRAGRVSDGTTTLADASGSGCYSSVHMVAKSILNPILHEEALTRGLGDPEARILIEWLVDYAEGVVAEDIPDVAAEEMVHNLCRRARSISRFVHLWCHQNARGAACQLAATERFTCTLPIAPVDPCELMQNILSFEISRR